MGDSKWLITQSSLLPAGLLAFPKAKILLQCREPSPRKRRATQGTLPASLPEHALYSVVIWFSAYTPHTKAAIKGHTEVPQNRKGTIPSRAALPLLMEAACVCVYVGEGVRVWLFGYRLQEAPCHGGAGLPGESDLADVAFVGLLASMGPDVPR